jgi:hypothetical protein
VPPRASGTADLLKSMACWGARGGTRAPTGYAVWVKQVLAILLLLCVCVTAFGQKGPSIVGTWVAAKEQARGLEGLSNFEATFLKNGTFTFKGLNTVGNGNYRIEKGKVFLVLSKRNGSKPTHPKESKAEGTIVENGKAILLPSGLEREGKQVMLRIVRK